MTVIMNDSWCSAKFTLEFDLKPGRSKHTDITKIMTESLKPEMKDDAGRSGIEIRSENNKMILNVTARDVSALRAAINSNLRLLCCAAEVFEKIAKNPSM